MTCYKVCRMSSVNWFCKEGTAYKSPETSYYYSVLQQHGQAVSMGGGGGAKSKHTDAKVSGSENYAANTEYNRNKLYTKEMLKLLINISRRCFLMEMC